jgi:methionyl-tRNA synthetase
MGINLYRVLICYLAPVLPKLASKSAEFLNITVSINHINQSQHQPLFNHTVNTFQPLLQRIDPEKIKVILNESK